MRKRSMSRQGGNVNKRLKRIESAVTRNKGELKFITGTIPANQMVTGAFDLTELITPGTSKSQRVGDTIRIKKVVVRQTAGATENNRFRLQLYSPVDASEFQNVPSTFTEFTDTNQYRVWADRLDLQATNYSGGGSGNRALSVSKTFSMPMKVKYKPGTNDALQNTLAIWHYKQSTVDDSVTQPLISDLEYKVWYYDS